MIKKWIGIGLGTVLVLLLGQQIIEQTRVPNKPDNLALSYPDSLQAAPSGSEPLTKTFRATPDYQPNREANAVAQLLGALPIEADTFAYLQESFASQSYYQMFNQACKS
ncbi:MAG: hypothetical protein HC880_04895 [Bacteroidia bacterium]|nr:hypothetical protein [Bacteroidia bacterium]